MSSSVRGGVQGTVQSVESSLYPRLSASSLKGKLESVKEVHSISRVVTEIWFQKCHKFDRFSGSTSEKIVVLINNNKIQSTEFDFKTFY